MHPHGHIITQSPYFALQSCEPFNEHNIDFSNCMRWVHACSIIQRISTAFTAPCPAGSSFPPSQSPTFCLFQDCHTVGIRQCGTFPDWLLSLTIQLHVLYTLSRLHTSFLFSPLSGRPTVYLLTYFLKNILVDFKCWQLWTKLLQTSMCRFLCEHKFSAPLCKQQRAWLLGVCLFL